MNKDKLLSDEIIDMNDKYNQSFNLNQNNELYDEEEALKKHKLISLRRISLPNDGENWELTENGRRVITLNGVRLTKKEKKVLRTVDGIRMIISKYKSGEKSFVKLKACLKDYWKENYDNL